MLFLSSIGFDSTVLVDFIISPETDFSEFFILYLETCCVEKRLSLNFNYDLQHACSELDIVDEYLDMDPTELESEDEEIDSPPRLSADVHINAPSVNIIKQCLCDGAGRNETPLQFERDMTSWPNLIRDELSSSTTDSCKPRHLTKSSKPEDEFQFPAVKRQKLNQQDQYSTESQCQTEVPLPNHESQLQGSQTSKLAICLESVGTALPKHSSRSVENSDLSLSMTSQLTGANDSGLSITSRQNEIKGASSFTSSGLLERDSPSSSGPPVETLVKVLMCFIEVRNLLSRSTVSDLFSLEHNNTRTIISSVDSLESLYSSLLADVSH